MHVLFFKSNGFIDSSSASTHLLPLPVQPFLGNRFGCTKLLRVPTDAELLHQPAEMFEFGIVDALGFELLKFEAGEAEIRRTT